MRSGSHFCGRRHFCHLLHASAQCGSSRGCCSSWLWRCRLDCDESHRSHRRCHYAGCRCCRCGLGPDLDYVFCACARVVCDGASRTGHSHGQRWGHRLSVCGSQCVGSHHSCRGRAVRFSYFLGCAQCPGPVGGWHLGRWQCLAADACAWRCSSAVRSSHCDRRCGLRRSRCGSGERVACQPHRFAVYRTGFVDRVCGWCRCDCQ